jgi:hypothetical protein
MMDGVKYGRLILHYAAQIIQIKAGMLTDLPKFSVLGMNTNKR